MNNYLIDIGDRTMAADSDEFYTPRWLRDAFGTFDLDPCAAPERRTYAHRHIVGAEGGDGLTEEWGSPEKQTSVYVNPPYNKDADGSQLARWTRRCAQQVWARNCKLVVALIPCRPSESYWRDYIFGSARRLVFIHGRVAFANSADMETTPGTFASVIVVWGTEREADWWTGRLVSKIGGLVTVARLD